MSTEAPKCKLCGHVHPLSAPHIWTIPVAKVATTKQKPAQKVATSNKKAINVATPRQVSIRELNMGISGHLENLPFEVTKWGKVIARVIKP